MRAGTYWNWKLKQVYSRCFGRIWREAVYIYNYKYYIIYFFLFLRFWTCVCFSFFQHLTSFGGRQQICWDFSPFSDPQVGFSPEFLGTRSWWWRRRWCLLPQDLLIVWSISIINHIYPVESFKGSFRIRTKWTYNYVIARYRHYRLLYHNSWSFSNRAAGP